MTHVDHLLSHAIQSDLVRSDPNEPTLTIPRTWGVYEIQGSNCGPSGLRYRVGNHPVRITELRTEFDRVSLYALFKERSLAKQVATSLNRQ